MCELKFLVLQCLWEIWERNARSTRSFLLICLRFMLGTMKLVLSRSDCISVQIEALHRVKCAGDALIV